MERTVMVIVPAFNEGAVIKDTLERIVAAGFRVILVDDGSRDHTPAIVRDLPVTYIRHAINLGQGAALQTGMTYALRSGADIAVHFDADGQHACGQIERLIAPIVEGTVDVVFGSRFLNPSDLARVPIGRRALLRVAIIVSWLATGVRLSDAHNGFRAFSRRALSGLELRENGFAHATEILQRVREQGLRYAEVPTTITYSNYSRQKGQKATNSLAILFDLIVAKLMQ
jgi:glycosyltransferase involved in cell wall biosynthesis